MLYTGAGIIMNGSDATAKVGAEFRARNFWILWIFRVVMLAAILFDLYLVLILKDTSISLRTWTAVGGHPAIGCAGILATTWLCYLLRQSWPDACFAAGMGFHLFTVS